MRSPAQMSIADAGSRMHSFVFNVIARSFTKLSRWFLYSFVPMNHLWNRFDPFAKQKDASKRKGVVGRTGRITPTAPMPRDRNANNSQIILNGFFFMFSSCFQFWFYITYFK